MQTLRIFGIRALCALLSLSAGSALAACRHSASARGSEADGERIFQSVCARCHGADGQGGPAVGGANPPRNFRDAAFQASRSDEALKLVIQKGKGGMPAFGNLFSPSELDGLVLKLRSFGPSHVSQPSESEKGH